MQSVQGLKPLRQGLEEIGTVNQSTVIKIEVGGMCSRCRADTQEEEKAGHIFLIPGKVLRNHTGRFQLPERNKTLRLFV